MARVAIKGSPPIKVADFFSINISPSNIMALKDPTLDQEVMHRMSAEGMLGLRDLETLNSQILEIRGKDTVKQQSTASSGCLTNKK